MGGAAPGGDALEAGERPDDLRVRNPTDPRDWNHSPSAAGERRGTSDRFALAFVKPAVR